MRVKDGPLAHEAKPFFDFERFREARCQTFERSDSPQATSTTGQAPDSAIARKHLRWDEETGDLSIQTIVPEPGSGSEREHQAPRPPTAPSVEEWLDGIADATPHGKRRRSAKSDSDNAEWKPDHSSAASSLSIDSFSEASSTVSSLSSLSVEALAPKKSNPRVRRRNIVHGRHIGRSTRDIVDFPYELQADTQRRSYRKPGNKKKINTRQACDRILAEMQDFGGSTPWQFCHVRR